MERGDGWREQHPAKTRAAYAQQLLPSVEEHLGPEAQLAARLRLAWATCLLEDRAFAEAAAVAEEGRRRFAAGEPVGPRALEWLEILEVAYAGSGSTADAARAEAECQAAWRMVRSALPENLGFESGELHPWAVASSSEQIGYRALTVTDQPFEGRRCAALVAPARRVEAGSLLLTFDARPFFGRRLRFSVACLVKGSSRARASCFVQLTPAAPRASREVRPVDTSPIRPGAWTQREIEVTVDRDTQYLLLGVKLVRGGTVYVDAVSIELVE